MQHMEINEEIRNVAIIAHVDHGKTTLVDAMFRQSGVFRSNQIVDDRVMDTMDLEKERGITIAAKNCSIRWKDTRINIIDTPGHADFGGEVERALSMADGAILLVDASEGPLPQTRFVLKKALEAEMTIIVVVNKIDRKDARPTEVLDEVYDLLIDLEASDEQLDFPVLYAIGRDGIAQKSLEGAGKNLHILLDAILEKIPGPSYNANAPFQMLVSDVGYSDYLGRLAIGKIFSGKIESKHQLLCMGKEDAVTPFKVSKLQVYQGVVLEPVESAETGDIVVIAGHDNVQIGDTISHKETQKALKRLHVDEPTVSMKFTINSSPFSGREGKYVQSSRLRERLIKETLMNVSIQVEKTDDRDMLLVKGRGELQLSILIETMRREGYEFSVGRPKVIFKMEAGIKKEPIERLLVDCEEPYLGVVTEKLSIRKGKLEKLDHNGKGRVRIEFSIPSRALIGYRDEFLTDTRGTGIMHSILAGYEPYRGDFPSRFTGSLVADRSGRSVAFALYNLEPRGKLFIVPGHDVYEGMIIGENARSQDMDVNPCKLKKLTNMRASGKDDNIMLSPVNPPTLEQAIRFIRDDELVEITPKSIRMRKAILPFAQRKLARSAANKVN